MKGTVGIVSRSWLDLITMNFIVARALMRFDLPAAFAPKMAAERTKVAGRFFADISVENRCVSQCSFPVPATILKQASSLIDL